MLVCKDTYLPVHTYVSNKSQEVYSIGRTTCFWNHCITFWCATCNDRVIHSIVLWEVELDEKLKLLTMCSPCTFHFHKHSLLTNQTRYSLHVCHFQFYHMIHTSLALLLGWIYVEKCSIHYKLILRGTYASSIDMLSCYTLTHCLLIVQSPLNLELFLWTSTFLS